MKNFPNKDFFFDRQSFALFMFLLLVFPTFSQNDSIDGLHLNPNRPKKILVGLYVGSYFANKYSASTYNGYGFDVDGNRNSFINSFIYQKIIVQYGGAYGQPDQIADAIGVDRGNWTFNESDMPVNMRYTPAIMVGLNLRYAIDKKSAFLFNLNGAKINVDGNFTITTLRPQGINPANNTNIKTFVIKGGEQRLQFQLGFQRILGDDDKLNFFVETGIIGTLSKVDNNIVYINNLQIDLLNYVNQALYATTFGPVIRPIGFGVGAFAGIGTHLTISPKFTLQLLYTPSYEKISIGTNPTLKLQNSLGLRVYYNF